MVDKDQHEFYVRNNVLNIMNATAYKKENWRTYLCVNNVNIATSTRRENFQKDNRHVVWQTMREAD